MQVFFTSTSCFKTASQLDKRRLNKQIIEAAQIILSIDGYGTGWLNHPVTQMYRPYKLWLQLYHACLKAYKEGDMELAEAFSRKADTVRPPFVTDKFCNHHARRLYTKAPGLYPQFATLGTSIENWYVINGETIRYVNGKRIKKQGCPK